MKSSASISEIFFGRIGFGLMSALAGLVYGLAASLIIFMLFKKLSVVHIVKVFVYVFAASGFILGRLSQKLIESMFYPLSFLFGAALAASANVLPEAFSATSYNEISSKSRNSSGPILAAILGFVSVMLCFLLW